MAVQMRDDALAMAARHLVQQIRLSEFKDELNHRLVMNVAFLELEELVMPSPSERQETSE
ncbi:hypothetical protein DJ018_13420 [Phenylobacterium deserti]|uniref:Uncharacterized protein n=1 Tax=Phenylobacterium deserti TaxID=1914756 RepID=A0A328ABX8_9CAUL|nr:hypothetical protein DJ018_13420 [Phenylobacterium deserti]